MDYMKLIHSRKFIALAEKDPHAAVKKLGLEIEDSVKVKVTKNTAKTMFVVLPPEPLRFHSLEDGQLQSVSGGAGPAEARVGVSAACAILSAAVLEASGSIDISP